LRVIGCRCDKPRENPRRTGYCRRCGNSLGRKWQSTDENMTAFLRRLASLPGVTAEAILHAQQRERAGREEFGFLYLSRNNDAEGQEEAADLVIYPFLSWLNDRRDGVDEIDLDLLDAAHHAALAHAALQRRRLRRE
jgi:hypothetical protein